MEAAHRNCQSTGFTRPLKREVQCAWAKPFTTVAALDVLDMLPRSVRVGQAAHQRYQRDADQEPADLRRGLAGAQAPLQLG